MTVSLVFFFFCCGATFAFLLRYVRLTLSLSSTAIGLLFLFHGPAYWYYTRQWGLGEGALFGMYNKAWGGGQDKALNQLSSNFHDRIYAALINPEVISTMDIALALTMSLVCVGVWLADKVSNHSPATQVEAMRRWGATQVLPLKREMTARLIIAAGFAILFMLYFMAHDGQLLKVYSYFFTRAGEFEKIAMRREMGGSQIYAFNLMLCTFLAFMAFCLLAWWREGNQYGIRWLAWAIIFLVFAAKLATLSKAPAAVFVLQLLVIEMARRSLQVCLRSMLLLGGGGGVLFSLMTFVANSNLGGVSQSLIFLFYRVFMIPNESILEYFAAFPQQLPHTLGHDIRWLATLLGTEPLQANFWRVAELHRGVPGSSTTAMFMANAWAAFSWSGVLATSLAFGFLLRLIDIQLITRRGRTLVTIAGLGLGHYGIFIGLSTAFQTALLTGGLLLILPLIALLEWRWPWRVSIDPTPS